MQLQLIRDIEQIKKDNRELGLEHNSNKEIVREFRHTKLFGGNKMQIDFTPAKCDGQKEFFETIDFLKTHVTKICRENIYSPPTERVIKGRLGVQKGYVEDYKEIATELNLKESTVRDLWSKAKGPEIVNKLRKLYLNV